MNALTEADLPSARVRATIDEVLGRAEFAPPEKNLFEWIAEKVAAALREFLDLFGLRGVDLGAALGGLVYLLLAIALAALLWLVLRRLRSREGRLVRRADGSNSVEAERLRRVADLRAQARDAAQQGDDLRALRLYFTALVIGLSERGDLEYRDSWTNRELFERGAPRSDAARELALLVPALDRKSFGREPAEAADVERLATLCDRWLGNGR